MKLHLEIDHSFLYYSFFPFVRSKRKVDKNDIKEIYVRKYSPIWEYGGWGYRVRPGKGKALNVKGNRGLQLVLKDGSKILIGTSKHKELEKAIEQLKENWNTV